MYVHGKMLSVTKYGIHILVVYISMWSMESSFLRRRQSNWSCGGSKAAQSEPILMPSFPPTYTKQMFSCCWEWQIFHLHLVILAPNLACYTG